jgi:hypothetical protein
MIILWLTETQHPEVERSASVQSDNKTSVQQQHKMNMISHLTYENLAAPHYYRVIILSSLLSAMLKNCGVIFPVFADVMHTKLDKLKYIQILCINN